MTGAPPARIAVVGAGMAAARFAQRYTALGGRGTVTLYGAEPHRPYNRVLLADVLTGRYDPDDLTLPMGGARLRAGDEVMAVDVAAGTLTLASGRCESWDALVLATGANPVLPPLGRLPETGVHSFRGLADCAALAAEAGHATRAVVIGGGVLGVSAARALADRPRSGGPRLPVEIVHQAPHLIERHLDEGAAAMLRRGLAGLGVETYLENRARAVLGDRRVTGVRLANGHVLDCDLLVLACGVRPRTGLARAAGVTVRDGVVVDDRLAASVPGVPDAEVYAIGDCAEHRGVVHGLSTPAWEQAEILAARLSGAEPEAAWPGWLSPYTRLTAGPLAYASLGELVPGGAGPDANTGIGAGSRTEVLRLADATRGTYRSLRLREGRLVGGVLYGDLDTVDALTGAYRRGEPVPEQPLELLIRPADGSAAAPHHTPTTQGVPST
ncbi:NAD(P)/FAD-dependent oxidoreductase [Phaeacidiphilus oryzae]|uniref:NAD(P)/FAD-dependent oxidoreductase n=1 Tax=Phaeacidiphilus oryzae TaxID=348818 RepID=UPI00068AAEF6|nr:FAD-dependent oxidoreductase [Phaeacidiphilus oryzae]